RRVLFRSHVPDSHSALPHRGAPCSNLDGAVLRILDVWHHDDAVLAQRRADRVDHGVDAAERVALLLVAVALAHRLDGGHDAGQGFDDCGLGVAHAENSRRYSSSNAANAYSSPPRRHASATAAWTGPP